MLVLEYKVVGNRQQYCAIDEAIRTTQFIRNKAIRYWIDASRELKVNKIALNNYSTALRKEFAFVAELNSMACQSATERALASKTGGRLRFAIAASGQLLTDFTLIANRTSQAEKDSPAFKKITALLSTRHRAGLCIQQKDASPLLIKRVLVKSSY